MSDARQDYECNLCMAYDGKMRILEIPRDRRRRQVNLHIKRDKMSTYLRRRAARAYSGGMQRARGIDEGPSMEQRQEFGQWVEDVVAAFTAPPKKWSVTRIAEKGNVHRNAIYDWISAKSVPKRETVARFCRGLGIGFAEPARILGWTEVPSELSDLEGFVRRARALAAHPKTSPERRKTLESQIAVADAALEMERRAEALLREALGESEDADT